MLCIEQVRPEVTWRLRQEVLYPDAHYSTMQMEEDQDGYHFGAFADGRLVAVVSLFQQEADCQFRKFAVLPAHQGKGIGRQLLQYIIEFAQIGGGKRLWCNARLSAVEFYVKQGLVTNGAPFSKNGLDYVIMEKPIG